MKVKRPPPRRRKMTVINRVPLPVVTTQQQQKSSVRCVEMASDVLSMVLVRWSFARLLHFSRLVLAIMHHEDPLEFEEAAEARSLEVECTSRGPVLFSRFYRDLVLNAASEPLRDEVQEQARRDYYRGLMRGCFTIALVKDPRVRRFALAHHTILSQLQLHCTKTNTHCTELFCTRACEMVDAFLTRRVSLRLMSENCVKCWRDEFMFRVFPVVKREGRTYHTLAVDEDGGDQDVEVALLGGAGINGDEQVLNSTLEPVEARGHRVQ